MEYWFYMNKEEITAADIKNAADDTGEIDIELWREANVVEFTFQSGTVDFEPMKPWFKDKSDNEFLKQHKIRTLFAVTVDLDCERQAVSLFRVIAEKTNGFFCGDSEDFTPMIGTEETGR